MIEFKNDLAITHYQDAIEFMEQRSEEVIAGKADELIWLLQHPPLYSAGSSADKKELLNAGLLPVYNTNRGGKYVYHGPGQIIAYLVLDLRMRERKDVRLYVRNLENIIINSLDYIGIKSFAREGRVGIWILDKEGAELKIAAIGVHIRKWVTSHGFAININPCLEHYNGIVPCGINEYGITSLEELGVNITIDEFSLILKEEIIKMFC